MNNFPKMFSFNCSITNPDFKGISPGGVYEAQIGDHYYNGKHCFLSFTDGKYCFLSITDGKFCFLSITDGKHCFLSITDLFYHS